ncbi:MAG: ABC transporter permease, partial [Verrucomicrobia bacterium]|nr:ABC transporter permease [Verrucomicrobiota bacterium]
LHPAFAMIRSSLMILLGFVILLISTGILAMFASRFKENLEGLKKQRGQVTAAEVNKAGAIMTAFMLGLNNMHRRRVRTLLTCGTLVLITFVMICFTSVQNDIVDSSVSIGKAPFQGFVVQNERFLGVSEAEVFALEAKYGETYAVVPRRALTGTEDALSLRREYPQIRVTRTDGGHVYGADAQSVLTWSPDEPLARQLVSPERWFTREDALPSGAPVPILISSAMAGSLGIAEDLLGAKPSPAVVVNGVACVVRGVFSGDTLDGLLDLDGQNLLPFDIKALREVNKSGATILADASDPRVSGNHVIIAPRSMGVTFAGGMERILSVAVVLPETLSPKGARAEIEQFMEQSGRTTFFGLDGYAFMGRRARGSSFVGLIDMLVPLIIAALTVLNTIRGSVYERKEEIFVYNAVGIAPRHIFCMFFAEAVVYAVVGSVLGYILSQGTGKLLIAANLTGGLNMTFTSLGTIYASWAIAASVFVSTWFPARTAMEIASPATDAGWRLPAPDGDTLSFKLPFTFGWQDRIAVLGFFQRYFSDHGEGSSGPFFTGASVIGIAAATDPLDGDGYIPTMTTAIWLKPFDLGVSQELCIALPKDGETGEYVAQITLTRRSGAPENWQRLNRVFVSLLRTHFLHWRAVSPEERAAMYEEAKAQFAGVT